MPDRYPAKTVVVAKIFRASCTIPGCSPKFGEYATHAEANREREQHLTWHRLAGDEREHSDA